MTFNWFYRLSDWNPQCFRELKGRLKRRNVVLTVVGSLAAQLLVLMYFWTVLPAARSTNHTYASSLYAKYSAYCTGKGSYRSFECLYDALGKLQINWQNWWSDIFQALSWALPFVLLIAGVYMLISDLGKEERRGTLNFIRLSPQTSQSILFGKLLGVPAILYLAVVLAVPLHLMAANGASVSIANILSIYLLTAAACAFCYGAALLYALMGGFQGWVGAVAMTMGYASFFQVLSTSSDWQMQWFHLVIGHYYDFGLVFALLTLGMGTYWIWQALNRRFRNPQVTLLSKSQSYRMTLCFEVWMLGFVFRDLSEYDRPFENLLMLGFFNLLWFMVLIAALTPQRQMLHDWARYRRERVASGRQFWSRSIMKELLWGEKSPALVALALNLLIAVTIVTPWILGWDGNSSSLQGFATIILGVTYTLICAAIAQLILFMKSSRRGIWAMGVLAAVIILPPVMLATLQIQPYREPLAWLFSIGAFAALQSGISMPLVFIAFLGHIGILSLLSLRFTRQLQRAGESETKTLLAASRG